jgi:isopenicillin N synthase-like dioxygenase
VDYAKLAIVDLAQASTAEGRVKLAAVARDAMRDTGFFYAINHGLSSSEVCAISAALCDMRVSERCITSGSTYF